MFRVGFVIDGTSVSPDYLDIVDWVEAQPDMHAVLLRQRFPPAAGRLARLGQAFRKDGLGAVIGRLLFALLVRIEHALIRDDNDSPPSRSLEDRSLEAIDITPRISKSGFVYRYDDDELRRIAELDCDVLIRAGSGILRGGILSVSKHGILSLHHGDNRINRGGPPGFWEVYNQEQSTGFVVQRLTDELDGGEVLARGEAPTIARFVRNQNSVRRAATNAFTKVIGDVLHDRAIPEPPHIYAGPVYTTPSSAVSARYLWRLAKALATRVRDRWLSIEQHWRIGVIAGDWRGAVLRRAAIIESAPGTFLADPFVIRRDGRTIIFAEEYLYAPRKGRISAFELQADRSSVRRLGTALEDEAHLSFPFLIADGDDLFMCPESGQAGQLRLYRCTNFPLEWTLDSVLVDHVAAVDTMIFKHDEKYWMMSGFRDRRTSAVEPVFFSAPTVRGPWTRCANIRHAMGTYYRNGGLLRDGEDLYRVAQTADFGEYGSSIAIFKIDRITADEYVETFVQEVRATFDTRVGGPHHMHNDGDVAVFDLWQRRRVSRARLSDPA